MRIDSIQSFRIMLILQQVPELISTQDEIIQVKLQQRKQNRTLMRFELKERMVLLLELPLIKLR